MEQEPKEYPDLDAIYASDYMTALDLMIMSLYKPDQELRNEAKENDCFVELLQIREELLCYLHKLRAKT